MKKYVCFSVVLLTAAGMLISGCSPKGAGKAGVSGKSILEKVQVAPDDPLYKLPVAAATASSFDTTPDWAPAPDPMAPVDGNILTRWSSDYAGVPQWISFDFGSDSVLSNVIIRWEKAYATKYSIQGSMDGEKWQDLFVADNGVGGVVEANFDAVKCRYLRIFATEKAKEEWGISMWEVEIYGPKSLNPLAQVSKEQYLSGSEKEAKKKEADELIQKMAAPVVPLSQEPYQQGVVYTSWEAEELLEPASDFTLAKVKEMGFDTVSLMVPTYQDTLDSPNVYTNDAKGGDTPTEESLKHAIETCHKLGLRVLLKMHVDPRTNEARINIIPSEAWFDSYKKMIVRYATFAQANNVEIFSVGTELEGTTFEAWAARWKDVIAAVREVYKGTLTYSANWTEYKEVPFWQDMDFIGIDAYFPLTQGDEPTLEELKAGWQTKADEIEKWLAEKGLTDKGVVFTEVGYTSSNGTNRQPWAAVTNVEDQQEQADCFQAFYDVLTKKPWFKGYHIWQYMPQERWSPLGFTLNGKKAEEVVKNWIGQIKAKGQPSQEQAAQEPVSQEQAAQ